MSETQPAYPGGLAPSPPVNESDRLAALHETGLLDSPPEIRFDDITMLAARLCETPISLISLVDETRQWFKAKTGIDACETPREISFCGHAICEPDSILEIPDARVDPRFSDNPLVTGEPRIRFYAGVPLRTAPKLALGTLCVIDREPRKLTAEQRGLLSALARQVTALMELNVANQKLEILLAERNRLHAELEARYAEQRALLDTAADLVIGMNSQGKILFANASLERLLGRQMADVSDTEIADWAEADSKEVLRRAIKDVGRNRTVHNVTVRLISKSGEPVDLIGNMNARQEEDGSNVRISAVFRTTASTLMATGERVDFSGATCVCSWCKRVRNQSDEWQPLDQFLDQAYGIPVSHGICESCVEEAMKKFEESSSA